MNDTIECRVCGFDFDPTSPEKKRAGGKINECPDCAEETEVPYVGVMNADGKQAGVEIVACATEDARNKFLQSWRKNAGYHKGKSSALYTAGGTAGVEFKTVARFEGNTNHKGRQ